MGVNNKKRSSISVKWKTKDALDSLKHAGQSYDGLIQELIKFWKEKGKGGEAISR
ncbi:MAG TPA: hypothetical protein G4O07_01985 [Dehalococcoidia bacterium]|nr:hypothetical protein [Dehalococcoidia bacterium]